MMKVVSDAKESFVKKRRLNSLEQIDSDEESEQNYSNRNI